MAEIHVEQSPRDIARILPALIIVAGAPVLLRIAPSKRLRRHPSFHRPTGRRGRNSRNEMIEAAATAYRTGHRPVAIAAGCVVSRR